jgi:hypothetical protein
VARNAPAVHQNVSAALFTVFGGTHLLTTAYAIGSYDPDALVQNSLDTLAWVQHLLGRDVDAATTIRQIQALGGHDPEMLWHAAVIYAAIDDVAHAVAALHAAVAADPSLAKRADMQQLQQQLSATSKSATK